MSAFDPKRTEAAEVLRDLVEVIKVRNLDKGFEMELVGEIANMVQLAQTAAHKGKAASREAANLQNYRSSVKVVAGARNCLNLLLSVSSVKFGAAAS